MEGNNSIRFLQIQIGICLTEAGCLDPAFFVAKGKIEVKHTEVILVLASKWRKPYKALILQGKLPSSNLEKVELFCFGQGT